MLYVLEINMKKIILLITIVLLMFLSFFTPTYAGSEDLGLCDFFPCSESQQSPNLDEDVNSAAENLFIFVTTFSFTGIILVGIYYILRGSVQIIWAQGDASAVEKGFSKIKGVYVGIIILFVGLIGLVVLIVFFDGGSIFTTSISDPNSNFNLPFV